MMNDMNDQERDDLRKELAEKLEVELMPTGKEILAEVISEMKRANLTDQEKETMLQVRYASWRMSMWLAGYGTYNGIDQGVIDGKYTPGIFPEGDEAPCP